MSPACRSSTSTASRSSVHVVNIHQRVIARPIEEVGRLLDSLASDHDALWPRNLWPAMRFDRPLGVGADGGHGPVRYVVTEYEPGRRVRFRFKAPRGYNGWHELEVLSEGDGTLVRHTIDMNATGPALLTWPLAIRWLHDALLEDAFATAEVSLGITPTVIPWSLWVKFLRWAMFGGKARPQRFARPVASSAQVACRHG
jgi:hypothetical protein